MVDSGADIGVVRSSVGNQLALTATGVSASPTTGGGGIIIKTGLQVGFSAEDPHGASVTIADTAPVGVKSNNSGSDIIGVDQLAAHAVSLEWDAAARTGKLTVQTPAASSAVGPKGLLPFLMRRLSPIASSSEKTIVDHGTWIDVAGVRIEKRLWR
jgi:hypothetical protein